jgi:hypothetical protein
MPDLARALAVLKQMAQLADRNTRGRYERLTNEYQDALRAAYEDWIKQTLATLKGDAFQQRQQIADAGTGLIKALERVGQEHLPYAVSAIGTQDYVPSPDAWHMIADAITAQNVDIEARLVPDVLGKLERGVDEGTDLAAVADSVLPHVEFYAGNQWIVIQRLVGDFAAQAQARDDLIYPCRWVKVKDQRSCEACVEFAGEYESYDALLEATGQCVPGYFIGSPFKSCWLNCRCHIELRIDGEWTRV